MAKRKRKAEATASETAVTEAALSPVAAAVASERVARPAAPRAVEMTLTDDVDDDDDDGHATANDSDDDSDEYTIPPSAHRLPPSAPPSTNRPAPTSPPTVAPPRSDRSATPKFPPRESAEDIFDYLQRPDVRPFVYFVSIRRVELGDDGRVAYGPGAKFFAIPTLDEVLDRLTRSGIYIVTAYRRTGQGDQTVILAEEKRYSISDDDLRAHRKRAEEKQAAAAPHTFAPAMPTGDVAWLRDELKRRDDELRAERAARSERDRQLAQLSGTVAQLKAQHEQAPKPDSTLEVFRALSPILGGPKMELGQLDQIRQSAYQEGRAAGKTEGRLDARVEAMELAKKSLASEAAQLRQIRASLNARAAELAELKADLDDREADLSEAERDLIRREERVGIAEEKRERRRQKRRLGRQRAQSTSPLPATATVPNQGFDSFFDLNSPSATTPAVDPLDLVNALLPANQFGNDDTGAGDEFGDDDDNGDGDDEFDDDDSDTDDEFDDDTDDDEESDDD